MVLGNIGGATSSAFQPFGAVCFASLCAFLLSVCILLTVSDLIYLNDSVKGAMFLTCVYFVCRWVWVRA